MVRVNGLLDVNRHMAGKLEKMNQFASKLVEAEIEVSVSAKLEAKLGSCDNDWKEKFYIHFIARPYNTFGSHTAWELAAYTHIDGDEENIETIMGLSKEECYMLARLIEEDSYVITEDRGEE